MQYLEKKQQVWGISGNVPSERRDPQATTFIHEGIVISSSEKVIPCITHLFPLVYVQSRELQILYKTIQLVLY